LGGEARLWVKTESFPQQGAENFHLSELLKHGRLVVQLVNPTLQSHMSEHFDNMNQTFVSNEAVVFDFVALW
jgi:hypothetical protein